MHVNSWNPGKSSTKNKKDKGFQHSFRSVTSVSLKQNYNRKFYECESESATNQIKIKKPLCFVLQNNSFETTPVLIINQNLR